MQKILTEAIVKRAEQAKKQVERQAKLESKTRLMKAKSTGVDTITFESRRESRANKESITNQDFILPFQIKITAGKKDVKEVSEKSGD